MIHMFTFELIMLVLRMVQCPIGHLIELTIMDNELVFKTILTYLSRTDFRISACFALMRSVP